MTDFSSHFPLMNRRAHEVCGASAVSFATMLGGQIGGQVLWARGIRASDQLHPAGFTPWLDPQSLLVAQAAGQTDVLAVGEEALRSGAVALVVMELSQPIGLTEGRRLQLAAQAGKATGLCIIPEGAGSNAAQSRWRCAPVFDAESPTADSTLQRWEIIKNKSGTIKAWDVKWDAQTRRVSVVAEVAQ